MNIPLKMYTWHLQSCKTHTHTHCTHMSLKNKMFSLEMHDLLNLIHCQCSNAVNDFWKAKENKCLSF